MCAVTRFGFNVPVLPYAVVVPYWTSESLTSFVVQPIVAADDVIAEDETAETIGGVVSAGASPIGTVMSF